MPTSPTFQSQTSDAVPTTSSNTGATVPHLTVGRDTEPVYIHHIEKAYIGFESKSAYQDRVLPADGMAKIDPNGCTPVSTFHAAVFENATREIRDLVENTRVAAKDVSETVQALRAEHITFRIMIENLLRQMRTTYTVPYNLTSHSHVPSNGGDDASDAADADVSESNPFGRDTGDVGSNGSIISHLTSEFYSDPEDTHPRNSFTLPSRSITLCQSTSV
ncbi:hypothetical protein CVT24_012312 [Panaeolus cyanescens]|uniref:Uncharacterized protein n=1 Tax=Panaeolus cyanescens TaxID=181874 RepID=A0A409W477_9AGAR|nr:hypothetical protein CVT24_012312 [Panaeolus cyanescens]